MRSVSRKVAIAVVTMLVGSFATSAAGRLKPGEEATFAIPRMTSPPKIDGTIDPIEWRESVAVSGVVDYQNDVLIPRPTTFMFAWDPEHLYFACRTYVRPGYKPRVPEGRSEGKAYCYDDGLELIFKPHGQNVGAGNKQMAFRMFLNCIGYMGDLTRLVVGQQIKNWAPNFRRAVRITEPGTAPEGGSWWELEVSTSLDDFELTGPHRAGDSWNFMCVFNHMPGFIQPRLPAIGSFFTPEGKCVGRLVENTPAVHFTMDSLSNLASDGTARVDVKVYNPTKAPVQVKIDVDVDGKIAKTATLKLPPGGEKRFSLDEKLPQDVKEGKMSLRVTLGDQILLSCTTPFKVGANTHRIRPVPAPDPEKFAFSVKFNPVRGLMQISADSYMLPDPEAVRALKYEVKHNDTGKLIAKGEITKAIAWRYTDVLTLKNAAPGTYEATAQFVLKNGKTFGPRNGSFAKKNEAKAFAHWWGKDPGNTERVLPPFTAITQRLTSPTGQTSLTFACWGREYAINALGLPAAVTSQGGPVLAAPARIVVTVNGKEIAIPAGAPKITDQKDWRVRFTGKAEGAGLTFSAVGWMEQDGMVQVALTYQPRDGRPVKLDALRIEYPVANDVAECLASVGSGNNFAAMTATVLPTNKQGRLWSVFDTGQKGAKMKVGSFYPHVWLGSEQRGLQWWADSDRGWFPDDDVPAHEVVREGNAVVLKNNIIGKPVELTGPRTLTFTWIASPFKPLPKGWRMIAATDNGTFFQPHRAVRINPKTGRRYHEVAWGNCNWINPESDDPEEWAALWAEQKKQADASVRARRPFDLYGSRTGVVWQHMSFQLMGYGPKSIEKDVHAYFGDEWAGETWNETYTDYAMYLLDRAFGEGGVVSTYWDLAFPIMFGSPLSGLAYKLPDGRWQPGYNSLNCRRFFQRLWAVQDKHGLNPGSVGQHSTQAYLFPTLPWIDAVLDGERDWNIDVTDMDWIDYYPKERMRAMSVPHNWGVGICWMSNFSTADPAKRVAAKTLHAEYVWMHDSWINPYLAPGPTRMPQSILDWGLNGEDVVYHPYWRNPYVNCDDKDVLISLWRIGDDRVLIGVFNYNRKQTKNVSLKVDLDKLGLVPQLPWQEFIRVRTLYKREGDPGAKLNFHGRTLTVKDLKPHTGRFIGIRKY